MVSRRHVRLRSSQRDNDIIIMLAAEVILPQAIQAYKGLSVRQSLLFFSCVQIANSML